MKTKVILTSLFLSLVFVSCKKEEPKNEEAKPVEVVEKVDPNAFKVIFDVVAKKDDKFHLYYTEDGTINFPEEKSIWVDVKGNPNSQPVVFNFPEDVIPTQLRIDFNTDQQEESIQVKSFKMTYFGKTFEANGVHFFDYFGPNLETVTILDKENVVFKPLLKEGAKYAPPSFYPSQEALKNRIDEVTKK